MSLHLKIYGGTPPAEDLCDSCENLRVIRGHRLKDEIRNCSETKRSIPFPVSRCSYFRQRMDDVAWDAALHLTPGPDGLMVTVSRNLFGEKRITVAEYLEALKKPEVEVPAAPAKVVM